MKSLLSLFRRTSRPFGQFPDQDPLAERAFEDPSYPDGGPYKGESLADYHRRKWDELDTNLKRIAVRHLRKTTTVEVAEEARKLMEVDPEEWMGEHHFFSGVSIRNQLRQVMYDSYLPTGNWDDYYVRAFEEAIGGAEV